MFTFAIWFFERYNAICFHLYQKSNNCKCTHYGALVFYISASISKRCNFYQPRFYLFLNTLTEKYDVKFCNPETEGEKIYIRALFQSWENSILTLIFGGNNILGRFSSQVYTGPVFSGGKNYAGGKSVLQHRYIHRTKNNFVRISALNQVILIS